VAPAALAAVFLGIYTIDSLVNALVNIIYVVLAGGLVGFRPPCRMEPRERGGAGAVNGRSRPRLREAAATGAAHPARALGCGGASAAPPRVAAAASARIRLADRHRTMGRTFKEQGRLADAQTAWQHALDLLTELTALHPDTPDWQRRWCDCANDLAWLQLNHPDPACRDSDSAVKLASQVVARCSECGVYWNTMGAAYCRAGDFESALAALDRATALNDGDTAFDDVFLALAHAQLGNREQARHWLAQAMLRVERDYPGHAELLGLCDEARSLLSAGYEASATA
jgi:tetratricopeptide (TPR) repeat protein